MPILQLLYNANNAEANCNYLIKININTYYAYHELEIREIYINFNSPPTPSLDTLSIRIIHWLWPLTYISD